MLRVGVALGIAAAAFRPTVAQHDRVASTVHNLSVSGPGEIRALTETEVCKFCHVPHNAIVPAPLWGHELSAAQYIVPKLRDSGGGLRSVPQPDGSSRLCLSCHDGTVALGDIAGTTIHMSGEQRLGPGRRGYMGADLSGSHPISFVVSDNAYVDADADLDIGVKRLALMTSDPDIRLDHRGKMQCNTCHDPHKDLYYQEGVVPRFWVKPTVGEVCLTCHELR
jgi:hypothetical protein